MNTFRVHIGCMMFLLALLWTGYAHAGASKEIDSLQLVLTKRISAADRLQTLKELGNAYYNDSDFRKALETDRKYLELVSKYGTLRDSAYAFRHIGLVMMSMSWLDESLNHLMQAQEFYKRLGDTAKMATSMMNVGIVHDNMGNLPMSFSYYQQALQLFVITRNEFGIANCKLNTGILLTKQKKYGLASQYFQDAATIYSKLDYPGNLASAYINLGLAYKNQKKYDLAMDYHKKSFEIFKKANDKQHIAYYHVNMGELLLQMNKPAEAKPHLDTALKMSNAMNNREIISRSYEFLSDYYVKVRNYENAYSYLLKSKEINDSTLNAETVKKVSQIQYHYEIAKREVEKNQLVKQNLQKEFKITRRNTMIYIMASMLLLIALAVVQLIMLNRTKQKANQQLEAKNRLIGAQKEELIKLNASKDKFLSILAHDIKNPLSAILGISDILNSDYHQLTETQRQGFIKDILNSSSNLFDIVNTLLNWAISQNGMIAYQPKSFNLDALCNTTMNKLQSIAKLKDVSLVHENNQDISVFADDNMVMSVVHNLICNAIKYSHSGSKILISARKDGKNAEVSVQDYGIGIAPENQQKLFRYDQSFRAKGTTGESGTGIGLLLCKEFVERNNGKIWVESEAGKGSAFKFTLPVTSEGNSQV